MTYLTRAQATEIVEFTGPSEPLSIAHLLPRPSLGWWYVACFVGGVLLLWCCR